MDNERYAAVYKALLDSQGVENTVGKMEDAEGNVTYVIECSVTVESKRYAINCCFAKNSPALVIVPQITRVPTGKRADVLEACNSVLQQSLHTRFGITDDGWLEARSWSIFVAFEEEDFTGDVALEVSELYQEMASVFNDHLANILAAAK